MYILLWTVTFDWGVVCMSFYFLFSVVKSLQVGFKANERNVVEPVIVCRSLKNKEVTSGARSCISMGLVLVRKETRRQFGFCRARTAVGELFLLL